MWNPSDCSSPVMSPRTFRYAPDPPVIAAGGRWLTPVETIVPRSVWGPGFNDSTFVQVWPVLFAPSHCR